MTIAAPPWAGCARGPRPAGCHAAALGCERPSIGKMPCAADGQNIGIMAVSHCGSNVGPIPWLGAAL
eukprot:CAMPEP_0168460876 /NCGR_PEP_ID=MMETSP0228-20121227/53673_2 /TAXON_ID=133427 /ORGANISM="Protoceratium reticulatum, Strain CCCM 535 (=CCMP 1889)" /LENGTH=66 /DNA_ID= /DNA_START= /DNA_END= /DNA_ORIENTATION=